MIDQLPDLDNVFFIHYQCDDFEVSDKIKSLSVYVSGEEFKFSSEEEFKNIENYSNKVNELQKDKLTPIHWNQNREYFSDNAIRKRYKKITQKDLNLKYVNSINLSKYLSAKYGQDFVNHPRLDNLAKINKFLGIREIEKDNRTFDSNRILLLTKIFYNEQRGTLKISNWDFYNKLKNNKNKTKTYSKPLDNYITNIKEIKKQNFYNDLSKVFNIEKGKSIRVVIDKLIKEELIIIGGREYSSFIEEFRKIFKQNIGSYNSIQNPKHIDDEIKIPLEKKLYPLIIKYKTSQSNL